jgi:hypothetical protein
MKKKLIITESQYRRLINEQEDYTEQLLSLINSNDETNLEMVKEIIPGQGIDLVEFLSDNIDQIDPPYLNKFNTLGIKKNHIIQILKKLFLNSNITMNIDDYISVYDSNDNDIYVEFPGGDWFRKEYDEDDNITLSIDSYGRCWKIGYDEDGEKIYDYCEK